jgi:hypothetical protein
MQANFNLFCNNSNCQCNFCFVSNHFKLLYNNFKLVLNNFSFSTDNLKLVDLRVKNHFKLLYNNSKLVSNHFSFSTNNFKLVLNLFLFQPHRGSSPMQQLERWTRDSQAAGFPSSFKFRGIQMLRTAVAELTPETADRLVCIGARFPRHLWRFGAHLHWAQTST